MHIQFATDSLHSRTVEVRRDLHQHPELGYKETRTARKVAEELDRLGLTVRTGVAETGVVGLLEGAAPGPTVLVRADMDALPLEEQNDVPYRSVNSGVMHACGHDGHTAMLLSVAAVLAAQRDQLRGTVKFCFQPAEEGGGGARRMIEEGVLEDPPVDCAVALHLWNDLPCGVIGVREGPMLAGANHFGVTLKGKGAHAATPHESIDPLIAAAQLILGWQTVVSRNVKPIEAGVVTVASVNGGTTYNIIPESVELKGTIRAFSTEIMDLLKERMETILHGQCRAYGVEGEIQWGDGYPPTVNDTDVTALVRQVAEEVVGADAVVSPEPSMGAEDMSFFLQRVPGCYFVIGSNNPERGLAAPHHSPFFDFDEEALRVGVEVTTRVVLRLLASSPGEGIST